MLLYKTFTALIGWLCGLKLPFNEDAQMSMSWHFQQGEGAIYE